MKAKQNLEHSMDAVIQKSAAHGKDLITRIDYLDGWRGLAILLVLGDHFLVHSAGVGRLGVDIFFVLSGMLMSHILFNKRTDLKTFYKRRISRIMPVFVLYVSIVFITGYFFGVHTSLWEWVSTLTFLRTYLPLGQGIWDSPLPIGHLWSLNVEEHSYIIMSLIALAMVRKVNIGVLLILIGVGSQLISLAYTQIPNHVPRHYSINTECALVFVFYSAGYNLLKSRFKAYIPSWLPLLTLAIAVYSYYGWTPSRVNYISPALLAFTVNHLSETPALIKRALSLKPLRLMGIWSYSIYLWQQPFYQWSKDLPPWVAPLLAILAIAVGVISFYLIENPARRWINTSWKTTPSPHKKGTQNLEAKLAE